MCLTCIPWAAQQLRVPTVNILASQGAEAPTTFRQTGSWEALGAFASPGFEL
jgi:hypothetical protein